MTVAEKVFHWTQHYAVNIAALDRQHQGLFDTINELNDAMANGEGAAATDRVLQKLVNYALTHFAAEEMLMTRHNFPGLTSHKEEHQKFVADVTHFIEEYRSGKTGVPVSLLTFLQCWLKKHILAADKEYGAFLNARGVR
jgi:hemerythrin